MDFWKALKKLLKLIMLNFKWWLSKLCILRAPRFAITTNDSMNPIIIPCTST